MALEKLEARFAGGMILRGTAPDGTVSLMLHRGREMRQHADLDMEMPFLDAMALLFALDQLRQQANFQMPGDPSAH